MELELGNEVSDATAKSYTELDVRITFGGQWRIPKCCGKPSARICARATVLSMSPIARMRFSMKAMISALRSAA